MKTKRVITNLMIITMLFQLISFNLGISAVAASSFITTSGSVIIEAENTSYTVAGFTNLYKGYNKGSSSSASGGAYITPGYFGTSSDIPSGNLMHFTVNADVAGRYTLWVRSKATSDNNATWFDYDNNGYKRKSLGTSGKYEWVKLLSGYYMNSGGSVKFEFYPKDSGHEIDCFIFTNESSYVPNGIVSSLSQIVPVQMPLTYGTPSITPPVGVHPRLMMRSNDITEIISNSSLAPNTYAKAYFDDLVADYNFSGTLDITPQVNNYNFGILSKIEAHALNYAVFGNSASGDKAKNEILNYLKTVCFNLQQSDITREMGSTIFRAAEVYDWCYTLFTPAQRNELISYCESIAVGMETGYPVTMLGNITGHGSEFGLFRDLLALGVAVYDERPDIYNHVMGRIEKEMVPARDFYYQSHSGYQGTSYSSFRYHAELYAEMIVRKMTGGQKTLFSHDFEEVPYSWIYLHRPDGKLYHIGDDASTEWSAYNAYYFCPSFIAGNLFSDRLIKGEFSLGRGSISKAIFSNTNYINYKSFNSVLWLLINNPSVPFDTSRTVMPESRYFGSPNGMIIANSNKLSYATNNPSTSTTASALMKIGEVFGGNHDHLDAGSFQLYYKGILASASGVYDSYGSSHDINYHKRTISSNTLTVFKSSESFGGLNPASNDGGQKWTYNEANTFSQWRNGSFDRAQILDHKIDDNNNFSYIRGDLTDAYSDKVSDVQRAMAFISTDNADFPAFMAVYDKITSTNTGYTKKFILHTQTEPSISANTATVTNTGSCSGGTYNGKMNVTSLLPQSATISKVGGNSAFSVNGTIYAPNSSPANAEAGWGRLEISPKYASLNDDFLTIMTVSDASNSATVTPELILGTNLKGAKVLDKVVMFSSMSGTAKNRVTSSASFSVEGDEQLDFMIFGLKAGLWNIMRGSQTVGSFYTDDNAASVNFSGMGGTYSLSYAADQSARTMLSSLKYKIGENTYDIENFRANVFDYTVTIPANTTQINIIPTALDSGSTVQTTLSDIHSGKLATVTVSDGTNTSDYYITFVYGDSHILSLNATRNNGNDYSADTAVWKDLSGAANDVNLLPGVISGWTEQGLVLNAPLSFVNKETVISGNGEIAKKTSTINAWMNNGNKASSRASADYLEVIATSSSLTGMALSSKDGEAFEVGSQLTEDRYAKISFDYKNGNKDGTQNTGDIQFRVRWGTGTSGSNDQWIYCKPNGIYSNKNNKVIGNYNESGYTHFDLVFNLSTGTSYAFIDGNKEPVDIYTVSSDYYTAGGLQNIYFYGTSPNAFLIKNPEKVLYSAGATLDTIIDEICGNGLMLPEEVSSAVEVGSYSFSFVTPQITSTDGKNTPIITSSDGNIECYLNGANNKVVMKCTGIAQPLELDKDIVTSGYNTVAVDNKINVIKWYVNGVLKAQSSFSGEQLPCSGVMLSSSKREYAGSTVMSRLDWYNVALDDEEIQSVYNEYYEEGMESVRLSALEYRVHGNTFNIENFNSNVYEYNVTIPASATQLETVPTLAMDTSNVQTMWSDIDGGRRATITITNEQFTQTYYINFMYANPYILGLDVLRNNGSEYNASAAVWRNLNGSGKDVNIPSGVINGWTEQGLVLNAPLSFVNKGTVISGNGEIVKKTSTINPWMNDGTTASSRASADYLEVIATSSSLSGMALSSKDGAAFEAGSQLTEDRYAKISFDYKNGNKDGTQNTGNIQLRVRWGTGTSGNNDQWIYCRPNDIYSNKNNKVIGNYNESGYTHFDLVFNLSTGTSYAFIDGNKEPVDIYTVSSTYYTAGGLQNVYFYGMSPDAFLIKNPEKVLYSAGATLDTIIDEICGNGLMLPEEVSSAVEVGSYSFSFVIPQITSTNGKNTPIITSSDGNIECYLNGASNKVVLKCTGIAQPLELDKDIVTSGYNTVVVDSTANTISWYIDGELKTQSSLSVGTKACGGVMLSSAKSGNGGSVVISRLNWYGIVLSSEDISAQYTEYLNESFTGVSIKEALLSDGELTASIYAAGDFDDSSIIVEAYDDRLVGLDILDYTGSGNYNVNLSVPSGFDGYLKAFVWDFETLMPLTPFAMWKNTVK